MPFQARSYAQQPIPQPDPVQTLHGLMSLSRQWSQMGEESRARKRQQGVEAALATGKGDLTAAATALEAQGDWTSARSLRKQAKTDAEAEVAKRRTLVDQVASRIDDHKTIYGSAAQVLTELESQPTLYPSIRPKLVDLASRLDPKLADSIPEQYDPERVKGMVQFVQGGAQQMDAYSRAAEVAKKKYAEQKTAREDLAADLKIAGNVFSVIPNQERWTATRDLLTTQFGVGPEALAQIPEAWSVEAQETARLLALDPKDRTDKSPTTFDAEILAAERAGDRAKVQRLTTLKNQVHPPTERQPRAAADDTRITPAARAAAERWKAQQLEQLEQEFSSRSPRWEAGERIAPKDKAEMSEADLRRRQLVIENSYRAQLQLPALRALPASWGVKPEQDTTKPVTPPARQGGATKGVRVNTQFGVLETDTQEQMDALLKDLGLTVQR